MGEEKRPAFYAAGPGGWRDWVTLLHPPYTAWHLSYVVIGSSIAPTFDWKRVLATVVAFFFAVGIGAHALDELSGRPLRTQIGDSVLWIAALVGVAGAVAVGIFGITRVGGGLLPFIAVGAFVVVAYNLEWFGGRLHNDFMFAASWGAFPVLTAYFAQAGKLDATAVAAAAGAYGISAAQRALSTPARRIRRKTAHVEGTIEAADGTTQAIDSAWLLAPLETALKLLSWSVAALALALLLARL